MISTRLRTGLTFLGLLVLSGLLFSPVFFQTEGSLPYVSSSTFPDKNNNRADPTRKRRPTLPPKQSRYFRAEAGGGTFAKADDKAKAPEAKKPEAKQSEGDKAAAKKEVAAKEAVKKQPAPKPTKQTLAKSPLQSRAPSDVKQLSELELQVEKVAEQVQAAVVGVQVGGANGSAVIISKDGFVLSAAHVCGEPNRPVIFRFADGKRATGITLGVNKNVDGGMMKITSPGEWPFAPMGDSDSLSMGDWVVALGHPNGYSSRRPPVVRLGRILGFDNNPATLRSDCVLVGGDSGGPMFDLNGFVIGIHSRIGGGATNNLHVPVDTFWKEWDRLTTSESWGVAFWQGPGQDNNPRPSVPPSPVLGVFWEKTPKGVTASRISKGRAADRAGLKDGDILKKFDGVDMTDEAAVSKQLQKCKANQEVKLECQRDGKPITFKVKLDPPISLPDLKKQQNKK